MAATYRVKCPSLGLEGEAELLKRGLISCALLGLCLPSPAIAEIHNDADAARASERALLASMIEIQTVTGRTEEFERLTRLLRREFEKAGITQIDIKDHDGTQTLIARWPAERRNGSKPILLMAHMDVVDAKQDDWRNPPFELREVDGYYLGRGTLDNKGQLAGLILALQELQREGFRPTRDLVVLITGDEETTGNGARRAVSEWRSLVDAEYAINFDAGGGTLTRDGKVDAFMLQLSEKAVADFKLTATNRGGHSSSPRPDNAIYALAGAVKAIEAHRFLPMTNDGTRAQFQMFAERDGGRLGEIIKGWLADPDNRERADLVEAILPGYTRTRCVATTISGGHAPNALPQRAEANVNCRIFPGVDIESVRLQLQDASGPDVEVSLVEGSATPQSEPSPLRDDVLQAYQSALATRFPAAPVVPMMSSWATDGAFVRSAGIPVYGLSGDWGIAGMPSGSHGLDERMLAEAYHGQIPIIAEFLRRLVGN